MFARFAALTVQSTLREREIENLQTALRSSRQIGVATGVLMARELMTYDQAFDRLVNASQHLNVKLRDIAAEVPRPVSCRRCRRGRGGIARTADRPCRDVRHDPMAGRRRRGTVRTAAG